MSTFVNESAETKEDASNELIRVAEYTFVESDGVIQLKTTNSIQPKERYLRRRVARDERDFIWKSTNGQCYLCKQSIPKLSSWHVEHVVAFSENPVKNDVLGNMLPSCASCNLRKHDRDLSECITTDLTYDLATSSKDVTHLNTAAKSAIMMALNIKHTRNQTKYDTPSKQNPPAPNSIYEILEQIERKVAEQSASDAGVEAESSRILFKEMDDLRIRPEELLFEQDLANSDCISSGAFGEIYMGSLDSAKFSSRRLLNSSATCPPRLTAANGLVDVAIKIPAVQREAVLRSLVQEIRVLFSLQNGHPNIVTFYGWFPFGLSGDSSSSRSSSSSSSAPPLSPTPTSFGLVLEYCSHSLNMSNAKRNVDPVKVMTEVSSALAFLHSRSCLHRDVKPNNILICKVQDQPWLRATAKICDFGSAKYTLFNDPGANKHTYNAGTAAFRPPEVKRGVLVPESDVYSLGVTMYELSMGNSALLGDRDLYAAWERLYGKMRAYNHLDRPSSAEVLACLEHFAQRDFSTVALLVSRRMTPSKADGRTQQPLSPVRTGTRPIPATVLSTPTHSAATLSTADETADETALPAVLTPEEQEEPEVFIAGSARCRENPSGTRNMKYHASGACRHVAKSSCMYGIPLSEAAEFKHTACKTCGGGGSKGGTPFKSAAAVLEIELDMSKLAL